MQHADDRLSLAATAVLATTEGISMDLHMDGSGECGDAIHFHHAAWLTAKLAKLGFTPETYDSALAHATSARYAHVSGLEAGPLCCDWS